MGRLLLVDGSNLLFQMFFGMPARIVNEEGKAIQGTLGFVGALLKIVRMTRSTHLAVIFDGEHENPRAMLDAEYKANRPDYAEVPEEENPFAQLPDVYAALDYLAICHTETQTCETDDVIAAYALRYGQEYDIVISSIDSDFFQLISEHVTVLRYRGKNTVLCTPGYIRDRLGILPAQYVWFKSLTGDAADHIKGVPGVGPKTAARLLREFGTLEGIIANAARISRPAVRSAIESSVQRLRLNERLIRLDAAAALPFAPEELRWEPGGATAAGVLRGIGLKP